MYRTRFRMSKIVIVRQKFVMSGPNRSYFDPTPSLAAPEGTHARTAMMRR